MRAYMATNFMGSFAFDGLGNLLAHRLFQKKPEVMAEKLKASMQGEVLPEEMEVIEELKPKGLQEVIWDKRAEVEGTFCTFKEDNPAKEALRSGFREMAIRLRWASSQAQINELLSRVNVELTKKELRKVRKDRMLMSAVGMLDELDRVSNTLLERLKEWHGLYFPEAGQLSNERLLELIAKGAREGGGKGTDRLAEGSAGMDFSPEDVDQLTGTALVVKGLLERRRGLAAYIEALARETAPNMTGVAGAVLAARLLALAGGLEKIARMPSSTIQLLGAEKALFRHLKGEGRAPKYGILFGHPLVQKASRESKGKAARLVAAKLSLAARMDMYSEKDEGERLGRDLEEQAKKL
jgi:nucleolar protein 56